MKIRFKNYIIEDDRNGFILTVLGNVQEESSKNIGEEYIKEQIYPDSLENCFKRIMKYESLSKGEVQSFTEWIKEYKNISQEIKVFLEDIKLAQGKNPTK